MRPTRTLSLLFLALGAACGGSGSPASPAPGKGTTDFTTSEPSGSNGGAGKGSLADNAGATASAGANPQSPPRETAAIPAGAPNGRVADVEEADIYKVDNNRLFYLNTYRGFVIYDVSDAKKPQRLSRLPVYGYPIEMFVEGNTVYALLKDALYLTLVDGKLQFQRHNVSQLVTIDITDLGNPQVLKTVDIVGELREGVSRKIQDTIYVVSYIPQTYYWGWQYDRPVETPKEQAWVYSFNVAERKNPQLVQQLKIFEGGSISLNDGPGGTSVNRYFNGVSLSATANALMVVENWNTYSYSNGQQNGCGSYNSSQVAVVSLVDISDPAGSIQLHSHFETIGQLTDQFKQTYVYDPTSKSGTYFGIFARQTWSSNNCSGNSQIQNTIESWDVTTMGKPVRLHGLDFGKPGETVGGTAFDVTRQVAYAVTSRAIDPLYAISLANRNQLKVLSSIDGLSGDMSVFRLIGDNKFLLGIGQDTSNACAGFQGQDGRQATKIAVSIIDVRDLSKIRLVQRECVAVKNAEWVGSSITWDLDQAHKLIGMQSDGNVNVITVPVYYYTKNTDNSWWWYRYQTAVGMMTWDLTKYDDTKPQTQQNVLTNFGTFIHPNGEVRRSIVFTHQGATPERMMINLSDTHISIANIQDLANPKLESVVELAPYYGQIYRFGNHLVEHIEATSYYRGDGSDVSEFRVKAAGGELDDKTPVASFVVSGVRQVVQFKNLLVLFRTTPQDQQKSGVYTPPQSSALVYDLSDPTKPVARGEVKLPQTIFPYYSFGCGVGGYFYGYWFGDSNNWTVTDSGLVFLTQEWMSNGDKGIYTLKLLGMDLRDPQTLAVTETLVSSTPNYSYGTYSLVPDPGKPSGFYLNHRSYLSDTKNGETLFSQYKDYAQRWEASDAGYVAGPEINLPGHLVRTWIDGKAVRHFLAQDYDYVRVPTVDKNFYWQSRFRLHLLKQVEAEHGPAAELLDSRLFTDENLTSLLLDGNRLYLGASKQTGYGYATSGGGGVAVGVSPTRGSSAQPLTVATWETESDRLMIFDLAKDTLAAQYDQPTRANNTQLMGIYQNKLFMNLAGDGILVVDVSDPVHPRGTKFLRTLGYATHIQFAGDDAYVAAGYFGIYDLNLTVPASLASEN